MLSIVPLMNGGGLFETGAGDLPPSTSNSLWQTTTSAGTAWVNSWPWRQAWNTLRRRAERTCGVDGEVPGRRDDAFLDEDKSPTRRLGGIDNRGSHFYLCLFWAEALAAQTEDAPWLKSSRRWRKPSAPRSPTSSKNSLPCKGKLWSWEATTDPTRRNAIRHAAIRHIQCGVGAVELTNARMRARSLRTIS